MKVDVWPEKATFAPEEPVVLVADAQGDFDGDLEVFHLGRRHHHQHVRLTAGSQRINVGTVPIGGYAVRIAVGPDQAFTAFDVLEDPRERPRYGFLSDFGPDRNDIDAAIDGVRKLHLTVVQFYDWMYRHAEFIAPTDEFDDALGRRLSHATTRRLIEGVRRAGAVPMAYAPVYGAGRDYAEVHSAQVLRHHDGTPWMLADFLWIMDIAGGGAWRAHIVGQFARALELGFGGLHLDQYGDPKTAWTMDGKPVDLAADFPAFIDAVHRALPEARLIFNNVNDYPTHATAVAAQDAIYIEVWRPNGTYQDLADLISAASAQRPGKPVILAAYLEPFAIDTNLRAEWAARLALATIFAHGGFSLLFGEGDAVLTDPYYPNFRRMSPSTQLALRRYLDLSVAFGELLYDRDLVDITGTHFGGVNEDILVDADVGVTGRPVPGTLWIHARHSSQTTVVHLIDLSDQTECDWNVGKQPGTWRRSVRLSIRSARDSTAVIFTCPDRVTPFEPLDATRVGDYLQVQVPAFLAWGMIALTFAEPAKLPV